MTATTIIVTGVLTAIGGIIVALIARSTNRQTTAVAFSEVLLQRITAVESKVGELEAELTTYQKAMHSAVRFIDRLVEWGRSGGRGARPKPPPSLRDYLDHDMWGDDAESQDAIKESL